MYIFKKKLKILIFLFLIIFVLYGLYLYHKIHKLISGSVWIFPTAIYSRIINLEPGSVYSKRQILSLLAQSMYQKVHHVMLPGEYSLSKNRIELIRRAFDFPDFNEGEFHVKLYFRKKYLKKIKNIESKRNFSFFRLDPKLITILKSKEKENRIFFDRSKYPEILIKTLLAVEDKRFYNHIGINVSSIVRAFLANISSGRMIQGGSTLTQQLIKNLFLTNDRSIWRKINEIYMSLILECFYEKDRILELYLNAVYLGQVGNQQIRGFPLASLCYFGRPINELNLDQYALLVGMVKGASLYNPWTHPMSALIRRNIVLLSLYHQKYITKNIYDDLSNRSLNVQSRNSTLASYSYFLQRVYLELKKKCIFQLNILRI